MKLSLEQIRNLATGCDAARDEQGAIRFDRMPPAPAELYRQEAASRVRLECPSGVRLRFRSRTRQLHLAIRYGEVARPHYKGVLRVDDAAEIPWGPDAAATAWSGVIDLPPAAAPRMLELWLPHLAVADLVGLEVDDEVEAVAPAGPQWLACGDSITQGMTALLPTEAWTARLAVRLDADLHNWGVGGAVLDARLAGPVASCPYDLLTIAYGTNDFMRGLPPESYAASAHALLAAHASHRPEAICLLITPIPWVGRREPNAIGCTLDDYRAALRAVAQQFSRCRLVEGPDLIPDDPSLFADNVHPNAVGMGVYADHLAEHVLAAMPAGYATGAVRC